jgi:hypothetical protein
VCSNGTCVQCTTAKETACGAYSCNPVTSACTTTPKGSIYNCRSCVADSECTGGEIATPTARCVPMTFNGTTRGNYCLQLVSAGCSSPYSVSTTAESVSGAASAAYCGINQATTTCEAVVDMIASKTCNSDGDCGSGQGGLCKPISVVAPANRCTIPCTANAECLGGAIVNACELPTTPYYCH